MNGTDADLKPLLFTAHQDAVPPGLAADWTHPPFDGHYDGQWMWGRGVVDCKNSLVGLLSVTESLLAQGWEPTRTVVLAFGFDEEINGELGAKSMAAPLEERWGRHGFEFLLDEGGMGLQTIGDAVYALPGIAEKGYVDITLSLDVTGGHSSVPEAHTGIGIMADLLVELEKNPFSPRLGAEHPTRQTMECQAQWSPDHVEPWLQEALDSEDEVAAAKKIAQARGKATKYLLQTSQAVDLISGGTKVNALPENVRATVNYRIAAHENTGVVKNAVAELLAPLALKHNLSFVAYGEEARSVAAGVGTLSLIAERELQPAPITPTGSSGTWMRFAGVAREAFETMPSLVGKTVVPVGDIMTGNTDTKVTSHPTSNRGRHGSH